MAVSREFEVSLIASSQFNAPASVDWTSPAEASDMEELIEFAGRACYETFDRPNPRTADNDAYLRHIVEVGHHNLLEHATATLYFRGISRLAAAELMRHRHFSVSQLSQRFVPTDEAEVVIPDVIAEDEELRKLFLRAADEAHFVYEELLDALNSRLSAEPNALLRRKQARQAARTVLPAATESRLVVTGNLRTWRHFIAARASEHADREIRSVAIEVLKVLSAHSPRVFEDFIIQDLSDGTHMAFSKTTSGM